MSILGDEIHTARQRHGVTQRSLARRAGTTQAAITASKAAPSHRASSASHNCCSSSASAHVLQHAPLEHDLDPDDLAHARRLTPRAAARRVRVVEPRRHAARDRRRAARSAAAALNRTQPAARSTCASCSPLSTATRSTTRSSAASRCRSTAIGARRTISTSSPRPDDAEPRSASRPLSSSSMLTRATYPGGPLPST